MSALRGVPTERARFAQMGSNLREALLGAFTVSRMRDMFDIMMPHKDTSYCLKERFCNDWVAHGALD